MVSTSTEEAHAASSLRERKAAATRAAIVDALWRRLATTQLSDIAVDDLAREAGVSRMTFFNYFPTKEHAVDWLMMGFLAEVESAISAKGLQGVAAIEELFGMMGDASSEGPARMRRIYAYFASRPADRPPAVPSRADLATMGLTKGGGPGPATLGGMLMRYVEQAQRAGELLVPGTAYEVAHFLGSLATGASVIGSSSPDTDYKRLFRRHVRRALGLLGAPGASDPPPPKTPSRYRKERSKR
ncbi:MAG: TetR/AcrR family transcriptional regulator [Polyangiaceae bacterium]|nr:TetR/AcrR family transcriptional regulator [Polyangiaceae bacterium]MBK8943468.1 TetR/AcrR family transcriptional regulator [Polyangiaceae bacterium]